MIETACIFNSAQNQLIGIHHHKNENVLLIAPKAIVMVVGGPQTRVGSHRFFVTLARFLASKGIDVLRFDYTGAGDSEGQIVNFEQVKFDIHAAITFFKTQLPINVEFSLWGLCDGASAIALYLDEFGCNEIQQITLLNPWVNQPTTAAKTRINSYYWQRLKQASFWKKLFLGNVNILNTAKDVNKLSKEVKARENKNEYNYVDSMLSGLSSFSGKIDIILSENDLVAQEFLLLSRTSKQWQKLIFKSSINLHHISGANHTFANQSWKEQVSEITYIAVIT